MNIQYLGRITCLIHILRRTTKPFSKNISFSTNSYLNSGMSQMSATNPLCQYDHSIPVGNNSYLSQPLLKNPDQFFIKQIPGQSFSNDAQNSINCIANKNVCERMKDTETLAELFAISYDLLEKNEKLAELARDDSIQKISRALLGDVIYGFYAQMEARDDAYFIYENIDNAQSRHQQFEKDIENDSNNTIKLDSKTIDQLVIEARNIKFGIFNKNNFVRFLTETNSIKLIENEILFLSKIVRIHVNGDNSEENLISFFESSIFDYQFNDSVCNLTNALVDQYEDAMMKNLHLSRHKEHVKKLF